MGFTFGVEAAVQVDIVVVYFYLGGDAPFATFLKNDTCGIGATLQVLMRLRVVA